MNTKNKKEKNLKLYVWENVLKDYFPGIMFALAESPDQARQVILEKYADVSDLLRELEQSPKVVKEAEGFMVWGGG